MIVQTFRRNISSFNQKARTLSNHFVNVPVNCINIPLRKRSASVFYNRALLSYFSNEQSNTKAQDISLCKHIHPNVFKKSCIKNVLFTGINTVNSYPIPTNNTRHFSSATDIVAYNYGFFKMISESVPVEFLMEAIKVMHTSTSLPWWATVMLSTAAMRTFISLPMNVYQHQIMAKIENLKTEMGEVRKKLQWETKMAVSSLGWDASYAATMYNQSIRKEWKELILRENCHPFKTVILAVIQIPLWVCLSVAWRNLCYMLPNRDYAAYQIYSELRAGGFGWVTDLTQIDSYFILPILFGVFNLINIEIQQLVHTRNDSKFRRIFINFMRGFTICLIPFLSYIPSTLILFWTTNSFYTVLQSFLMLSPKFRRLGRVPKTDTELEHPYAEILKRAKTKYGLRMKLN